MGTVVASATHGVATLWPECAAATPSVPVARFELSTPAESDARPEAASTHVVAWPLSWKITCSSSGWKWSTLVGLSVVKKAPLWTYTVTSYIGSLDSCSTISSAAFVTEVAPVLTPPHVLVAQVNVLASVAPIHT